MLYQNQIIGAVYAYEYDTEQAALLEGLQGNLLRLSAGIAVVVLGVFGTSAAFGWAQWWYWRINFKGWCASVVAGPVVYLICGRLLPLIPWWAAEIARGPAEAQNMQLLQAVVALAVNVRPGGL